MLFRSIDKIPELLLASGDEVEIDFNDPDHATVRLWRRDAKSDTECTTTIEREPPPKALKDFQETWEKGWPEKPKDAGLTGPFNYPFDLMSNSFQDFVSEVARKLHSLASDTTEGRQR